MVSVGKVVVAHPGTQHSRHTALSLQQAGVLQRYFTGFYFNREELLARNLRHAPRFLSKPLLRELTKREMPGLNSHLVESTPVSEIVRVLGSRWLGNSSVTLNGWYYRMFGQFVARRLSYEAPQCVVCYDNGALEPFVRAGGLGIRKFLDQTTGHLSVACKLMEVEAELHPEFADSIQRPAPQWGLDRCWAEPFLADVILAPSEYVRDTLLGVGIPAFRIALLPYGVEIDRFRPAERFDGRRPFTILFVGRISQPKGLKYLLEAFRRLSIKDSRLVLAGPIVGSGAGLRPYSDLFEYVGVVPRGTVHELFRSADVFAYPSLHEGSALVTYEALASGLPVITTPNSGSVVRDGVEGFIVPIRDVELLAEKILRLYEQPELRREMARRARARAEDFTWQSYGKRLLDILRDSGCLLSCQADSQLSLHCANSVS